MTTAAYNSHIAVLNARHCPCADKYRADVRRLTVRVDQLTAECERLETERYGYLDRGIAALEAQAEETAKALRDLIQAETQRDEAVRRLREEHSASGTHVEPVYPATDYACDTCKFLASPNVQPGTSTAEPGPSCVWCGAMDTWRHTKDGKVWERGCQCPQADVQPKQSSQYHRDDPWNGEPNWEPQPCVRVSGCCGKPESYKAARRCSHCGNERVDYKCKRHSDPWPDEGECPALRQDLVQ